MAECGVGLANDEVCWGWLTFVDSWGWLIRVNTWLTVCHVIVNPICSLSVCIYRIRFNFLIVI